MGRPQRLPVLPHDTRDDTLGYILHPADLATNKMGAAYGRREPRDILGLITIHERIHRMGATIWAAVGKA